jgi:hypothetical protein
MNEHAGLSGDERDVAGPGPIPARSAPSNTAKSGDPR